MKLIFMTDVLEAHNNSNISVPIAKQKINLDGQIDEKEWNDAFKINFTSPRIDEGGVVVFLKYELTERSLSGAFIIPDKTPVSVIKNPDQIVFLFDTSHIAYNTTTSDIQQIAFIRNGMSEYYKGIDKKNIDPELVEKEEGESSVLLISNTPMQDNENSNNYSSLNLDSPFSRTDYNIISTNKSWHGEFKIYFEQSPRVMGFAIQQQDSHLRAQNKYDNFYINFPRNITQADIPSSWGDISFFELGRYVEYIQDFCPDTKASISLDNVAILCSTLNLQTIEENKEGDVVFVSGTFANLINGTGINEELDISLKDSTGKLMRTTIPVSIQSADNGTFESAALNTIGLRSGTYEIEVEPQSKQYKDLISTTHLMVNPHPWTIEETVIQLGTYIGIAATFIGLIAFLPQLRNYIFGKKQRSNMARQMDEINHIYDTVYTKWQWQFKDPKEVLHNLVKKRDAVLAMFKNNEINQEHYSLLTGKISECIDKLDKTIASTTRESL
jgi:hypothetical protein